MSEELPVPSTAKEEALVAQISARFPGAAELTRACRVRRVSTEVPPEELITALEFLREACGFDQAGAITGLDEGEKLAALYHLTRPDGIVCTVKTVVSKGSPTLQTIRAVFPVAELYERELVDLLGFVIEGLPEGGKRYPLPDDWPKGEYPLRKEWKCAKVSGEES